MLDKKIEERLKRTLDFQEADSVPICDFLDNEKVFDYFSRKAKFNLEDKVKAYHGLHIDVCWRFERRKGKRENNFLKFFKKHSLKKRSLNILSEKEVQEEFDDFKKQKELFEPYTYLAMSAEGCLSVIYRQIGFENFCQMMYTEPVEVERLIELFAESLYQRANIFAQKELGNLFFITDDVAYKQGLIFSPSFLNSQWLPRLAHAILPLKEKNVKVILHSDGNISSIIDQLIDIGIDGIHPVDSEAGMDIGIIKKRYAKSLLLFGNIVLYGQNPESIIEQTKKCIKKASFDGGHFIGSSSGIDNNIELKSVFSFFTAVKEFGKYPAKT